ncbi:MAG: hypothetical protein KC910_07830 [Candidatus Eremiobacteraeota bacterium]|nr:hypothetical protein [Candidatus Eremiobacteraeota bacterium]
MELVFSIDTGDIVSYPADVVLLKHAGGFHGADLEVCRVLKRGGVDSDSISPEVDQHVLVDSRDQLAAPWAIFMGAPPLRKLGYSQIRKFVKAGLTALGQELSVCRHLAMTIHGPGFGLDETESMFSSFQACLDAVREGACPKNLERITIVERSPGRVERLRQALDTHLRAEPWAQRQGRDFRLFLGPAHQPAPPVEVAPATKPHIFVAMPFAVEMEDVFYYGIQQPVHQAGYLCERVDKSVFSGDIVGRILERIHSATAVVADLTGSNANVYLEVGYAWGLGRPTILITKSLQELCFDVRGHRCLEYRSIKQLEQALERELAALNQA